MAKRQAGSQITKDRNDDSDGDYDDVPPQFQKASANIMARRKIARPGKLRHHNSGAALSNASFGFGSVSGSLDVDINSKITALNKRFLESVLQYQSTVDSNELVNLIPVCQKYIDYYNSIKPSTNGGNTNGGAPKSLFSSIPSAKPTAPASAPAPAPAPYTIPTPMASSAPAATPISVSLLPAAPKLNAFTGISTGASAPKPSFTASSSDSKPNPFSGISTGFAPESAPAPALSSDSKASPSLFTFGKPQNQASTVATPSSTTVAALVSAAAPAPVSKPAPAPKPVPEVVEVSSSDESLDDEVKIQGPQFVLSNKPTIKNSPFTFGPKPEKKKDDSDSDLESEVEIKGPTFTFNKTIKDSVFKFKSQETQKLDGQTTPVFSFGQTAPVANKEAENSKPVFSFGLSQNKPATDKPAFSFGQKSDTPAADKPAFSFGQKVEQPASDKPAFSFGSAPKTSAFGSSSTVPAFNFSASLEEPKVLDASETEPKTTFAFGGSSTAKSDDKPAFSFGTAASAKPVIAFGNGSEKKSEDKPAFSFNSIPNTEKTEEPKPAFSFGGSQPFAFGSSAANNKPAFGFGQTPAESSKPVFQFNSSSLGTPTEEKKDDNKPTFLFGSSSSTGFGSSAPKFNLGGANGTSSSLFGGESKPGFGFSFGGASSAPSTATEPAPAKENAVGEVVEGSESTAKFDPVVKLTEEVASTTGEENESTSYTKRAKLMLFQKDNSEEPYKTIGLGDLKVLKHNESGKSRILVRTDGGQRILLNSLVDKQLKYEAVGNGSMVRVPVINPESKLLDTYVVKVKTPADGKELLEALQQAQN